MRAARWHGPRDVRVDDVPEPRLRARDDVLVKIDRAMICASDLAEWRDGPHIIPFDKPHALTGQQAPITLGHEYVGHVVETGAGVTSVRRGDRVCGDSCLRCNRCYWCVRGEYNICEIGASVGLHADGAFAPFLVVPDYSVVTVPPSLPDNSAAVVEPLAVGLHGLRQTQVTAGDVVVVVGFGMIGAACAMMARALGVAKVIVVEPSEQRSNVAYELGVDLVLPPAPDVRRVVRSHTKNRGADAVLECTGRTEVLADAVDYTRRGGRVGLLGIAHGQSHIRVDRIVYFEREIVGCLGYRFDHHTIIDLMANGSLQSLTPLFAEPLELTDIVEGGLQRMMSDPSVPLRIPLTVD